MTNDHREQARETHAADCVWQRITSAECEYRDTHHYCPHLEHACSCSVWNPTEEEAEAILRANGTSSREVVNGFIERLLKERSEVVRALSARNQEIKEVLEVLSVELPRYGRCWCPYMHNQHGEACLAARKVWEKVKDVAN